MFLPIHTDYQRRETPWVNICIIVANVAIFLAGYNGLSERGYSRINDLMLQPHTPQVFQFFTSVFLHANWMHLLGNMVFLWVFGNAVNDKFGNLGYLAFYLSGGILACVGYFLLSGNAPVLGASGAISAVVGAYLVLLPRTKVTLLVFMLFIFTWQISSLFFILFHVVYDAYFTLEGLTGPGSGGVAYAAHTSGYVFGIVISTILLVLRQIPRDMYDLPNLIRQRYRRGKYQRMSRQGFDPFAGVGSLGHRGSRVDVQSSKPSDTASSRELDLRRRINQSIAGRDLPSAALQYLELERWTDEPTLGRDAQLDVANQLMAQQQYAPAARAYERFVRQYATFEHIADIHLMLGLLYGRYLQQYEHARTYLRQAIEGLQDPTKKRLAEDTLRLVQERV